MNTGNFDYASLNHDTSELRKNFGRPYTSGILNESDQFRILTPLRSEAEHFKMITKLKEKCIELTKLEQGWDGYKGIAVPEESAQLAIKILAELVNPCIPEPSIVSGCDGAIQIEWHEEKYHLEFEIINPNEIAILQIARDTREMKEYFMNVSNSVDLFDDLYNLMVQLTDN